MIRRLHNLLQDERGIALPTALIVLGTLTLIAASLILLAGSNGRAAEVSSADSRAFALAEGGIAEGLAILRSSADPLDGTLLPGSGAVPLEGGTTEYAGTLDSTATPPVWTITATGTVVNPSGPTASDRARTIVTSAQVTTSTATDPQQWDRIYHDHPTRCLVVDTVSLRGSVTSRGDICLRNGGQILPRSASGTTTRVRVGDDVTTDATSSLGTTGTPLDQIDVAGRCRLGTATSHRPCIPADNVFGNAVSSTPGDITKPQVDFDFWYANAKPGPAQNCTIGSFPGGFDNDGFRNRSRVGGGEITPTTSSYTCQVWNGGTKEGELSWNHATGVLTVHGTIYIDGDVRFDDDGQLVNYVGRGVIYASGDLEFDELVCAGGDGTRDCFADTSNWDPETNQLVLLSGGWSEYDQGGAEPLRPAAFQGVIFATDHCLIHQNFHGSGPVICDEVRIEENDEDQLGGWPTFFDWPPLVTLVDGLISGTSGPPVFNVEVTEEIS